MSDGRMHDFTKVNFGQMQAAQEGLLRVVTELDRITDQLYKDIQRELQEQWVDDDGKGARSFFDQHRAYWDAQEKEMGNQLHQAAQAVGLANENYQRAENYNRRLWEDPNH
ncbi:hypothetical protein ABT294_05165 [Nonomuraea sp. NPDC000554]|uniref:WXG100 family type VII secretion target n=1 Tax=Nonomuraea sp. NPDC000554 TaxID=3154259 RepID=UPI0033344D33